MNSKRYFSVECKCGHAGKMYYIPIKFAIEANNGKEAAEKGRWIPRVKHHQKYCILSVKELTEEEYYLLLSENRNDPFLNCHSDEDQISIDLEGRKVREPWFYKGCEKIYEEKNRKALFNGKTLIRNPRKYMRNYCDEEAWS